MKVTKTSRKPTKLTLKKELAKNTQLKGLTSSSFLIKVLFSQKPAQT